MRLRREDRQIKRERDIYAKAYALVCRQKREGVHDVYQLVSANQPDANNALSARGMCKALGVSSSGYYDWRRRAPGALDLANLSEAIRKKQRRSDETLRHAPGCAPSCAMPATKSAESGWPA